MNESLDELGAEAMLAIRRYVEALVAREHARHRPWVGAEFDTTESDDGVRDIGLERAKRGF
jgi:hypothetical protein